MKYPNIWGAGALFCYSGLCGECTPMHAMCGRLLGDFIGIDFDHHDVQFVLRTYNTKGWTFDAVASELGWVTYVDISDLLTVGDYYRTDTHWRQEKILRVAQRLCDAMNTGAFVDSELTAVPVERPFYGVYYGQAALPMDPETIYTMENALLSDCTVFNFETGKTTGIYDMDKLQSRDLYDVYLSGAAALLQITNPNAATTRELVVFRDSFGSSLTPLLLKDYAVVTVVDTRYIAPRLLGEYLEFDDQDVLFLYSTSILNNSQTIK